MAKSLEEHLYRSAQTKDEYLDMSTLKQRLQAIAHGLEIHRSTSSTSVSSAGQSTQFANQQQQQHQGSAPSVASSTGQANSSWLSHQQSAQNLSQGGTPQHVSMNQIGGQLQGHLQGVQAAPMSTGNSNVEIHQPHSISGNSMIGDQGMSRLPTADYLQGATLRNSGSQHDSQWTGGQSGVGQSASSSNANATSLQSNQLPQGSIGTLTAQQAVALSQGNIAALQMMGQHSGIANLSAPGNQSQSNPPLGPSNWLSGQATQQQQADGSSAAGASGGGGDPTAQSRFQDPSAAQKKKVILQQQQRLLLLRHASKCTAGPSCPTKFCSQMVTLWRHMKTCRDKNCQTSHCLSSRCVLNHYRICKSNGKTSTCEVCGPVMSKIKQVERDDSTTDPLTREQEQGFGSATALSQPPPMPQSSQNQNQGQVAVEQNQLQQLQSQHLKLQARLESLQQLQKQQNQLLEQQRRLQDQAQSIKDPSSQQAQQLQQQQMLLSQLQKRCQQQQLLLQRELQEQAMTSTTQAVSNQSQQVESQHVPSQQLQGQQLQALLLQSQQLQAQQLQEAQHFQATQGLNPMMQVQSLESQASQVVDDSQVGAASAVASSDVPKKRRSRSEGKGARGGKGRRGSGKGKTMSQLAAATDVQPKKRQGASSPKERAQKKSKKGLGDLSGSPVPDEQQVVSQPAVSVKSLPGSSLVSCMTKEEISKHLESLNKKIWLSSRTVSHKCLPIVQDLIDDQFGWVFNDAVDPVALGLPDYFDVVKNPMHLELVKKKLENAIYADMEGFERDVKLVFENAILYNGEDSEVGELAQSMIFKFDKVYKAVLHGKHT